MIPKVVFLLGPPCSGKGTQCKKIAKEFNFVHLSAGDLLRKEAEKPKSIYGELIRRHIESGKIVPFEITCGLLEQTMVRSEKNNFIIDGFPRNQNNLEGWQNTIGTRAKLLFVIYLDCAPLVTIRRCMKRAEVAGRRSDDTPEIIQKRIAVFNEDTLPVVNYFKNMNLLYKIDASKSPDQIYQLVKEKFLWAYASGDFA